MSDNQSVSEHYQHGDLLNAIQAAIAKLGKNSEKKKRAKAMKKLNSKNWVLKAVSLIT
jgi:hypothetical protein